jgi:hypothetical protein
VNNPLKSRFDPQMLFALQRAQYSDKIVLSDSVGASTSKIGRASVSTLGHFFCTHITGHFDTLASVTYSQTAKIVDDGICHLRGLLKTGNGTKLLFNDYISLDLLFSPGRNRNALAVNNLLAVANYANQAYASPNLFFPMEFFYLFPSNTDILFDVKNDSNTTNTYEIVFHGIRILAKETVG